LNGSLFREEVGTGRERGRTRRRGADRFSSEYEWRRKFSSETYKHLTSQQMGKRREMCLSAGGGKRACRGGSFTCRSAKRHHSSEADETCDHFPVVKEGDAPYARREVCPRKKGRRRHCQKVCKKRGEEEIEDGRGALLRKKGR